MSGTTYAITEILLFLAGATVLGFLLGRLTATRKPAAPGGVNRTVELEAQLAALRAQKDSAPPPSAELQKDLEVARWEIEALQEEIARMRKDHAPAESPSQVFVEFAEAESADDVVTLDETALDETASGDTASGDTASGETALDETASGETASGETASGETADSNDAVVAGAEEVTPESSDEPDAGDDAGAEGEVVAATEGETDADKVLEEVTEI